MAKLVIFLDDKVLKEVALNKDRITLGRRPHNDVVIDNLAVSGEHAVLLREGDGYVVQDLGSTNGSYINGKPVKRAPFREGDSLDIGKYTLRLLSDARASAFAGSRFAPSGYTASGFTTTGSRAGAATAAGATLSADSTARATQYQEPGGSALKLRVVNGSSAGAELALDKSRTTFGQRGVMVVAIQRNPRGYELSQVEGEERVRVNGTALGVVPVVLSAGDVIEMSGGTRVQLLGA
ncbi:MAG: FHA domain-containing protein [Betaproteobacteria bacterium]|nr:FHA domain-containing protein [Betaproteobacteria bacterium]MBU6514125.1 FHA domain-containing protein [Betaproteobacteria bacterium]MDE1957305.1 FHA domain-containing protein [Betaproteobacteria bacterium]MDE2153583.1 FHA domain-containing protein [Betaproteobacteria bacterium]MDE2479827.1 FHA domain-containing protein [Betaproteobacteria bacterium]